MFLYFAIIAVVILLSILVFWYFGIIGSDSIDYSLISLDEQQPIIVIPPVINTIPAPEPDPIASTPSPIAATPIVSTPIVLTPIAPAPIAQAIVKCKCEEASCMIPANPTIPFGGHYSAFSVTRGWNDDVECAKMGLFSEANGWNCTNSVGTCCTDYNPCPKHVYVPPVITGGKCQAKQSEPVCATNAYYNRECPLMDKTRCIQYGCCEFVSV